MRYRLALFDFDGTLADSFALFAGMLDEVADRFGFARLDPREIDSLRGLDTQAILRRLQVPMWKLPRIAMYMRSAFAERSGELRLFPGIPAALRQLHDGGVELGIVSSNAGPTIQRILGAETAALVRHYECGASLFGKPSKLKKVLRRSGIAGKEAIYIGDEIRDAVAAAEAGLHFGAVSWGYNLPAALAAQKPRELFDSVGDMVARLTDGARAAPGDR
jgi:phosphoglycolate phosphatase